jgi:hypothetical protein
MVNMPTAHEKRATGHAMFLPHPRGADQRLGSVFAPSELLPLDPPPDVDSEQFRYVHLAIRFIGETGEDAAKPVSRDDEAGLHVQDGGRLLEVTAESDDGNGEVRVPPAAGVMP